MDVLLISPLLYVFSSHRLALYLLYFVVIFSLRGVSIAAASLCLFPINPCRNNAYTCGKSVTIRQPLGNRSFIHHVMTRTNVHQMLVVNGDDGSHFDFVTEVIL